MQINPEDFRKAFATVQQRRLIIKQAMLGRRQLKCIRNWLWERTERLSIKSNSIAETQVTRSITIVNRRAVIVYFVLCINDLEEDAII